MAQAETQPILKESDYVPDTPEAFTLPGRSFLLYSSLPYYTLAIVFIAGYYAFFVLETVYLVVASMFLVMPLLDMVFPKDWLNPDKTQAKEIQNSFWFKLPLYVTSIVGWIIEIQAIIIVSKNTLPISFYPGFFFAMGTMSGVNFTIAHELFHKTDKLGRIFGTLTMAKNFYMHFFIEHNWGHHKRVATPEDPASSREGESIYRFLPRTIIGSWRSAWEIENERLVKHKGYKSPYCLENRMIWFTLSNFLIPLVVLRFGGWIVLVQYLIIGFLGIVVLEAINYIEHYGLSRKKISPTEYERVTIMHSWNAPHRFTNYLLFKLQRHSDHHENAYKPYQTLLTLDQSPMLPHGYTLSLILAFFPNFWFKIMDPCLKAHRENRKLTLEEKKLIDIESYKALGILAVLFTLGYIMDRYYKIYLF